MHSASQYLKALEGGAYIVRRVNRQWLLRVSKVGRAGPKPHRASNGVESISASGLYFCPFRHIQTAFQFYLIFLSHRSHPSLTWSWFMYFVLLDGLCPKQLVVLQNRG